jgi:hypothetical protein
MTPHLKHHHPSSSSPNLPPRPGLVESKLLDIAVGPHNDRIFSHDGQVALQLMGRVTIQHTIQHSLQLMRCHRCHVHCSRSVLANLGCVCRPSWWIWLWPEAKAGPVWAKSGSKCIISLFLLRFCEFSFSASAGEQLKARHHVGREMGHFRQLGLKVA